VDSRIAPIIPVAALSLTGLVLAQDDADTTPARPMYIRPQQIPSTDLERPAVALPTWNGSFTYKGTPTPTIWLARRRPLTNASTTIQAYIIPLKIAITGTGGTKTTSDMSHVLSNPMQRR